MLTDPKVVYGLRWIAGKKRGSSSRLRTRQLVGDRAGPDEVVVHVLVPAGHAVDRFTLDRVAHLKELARRNHADDRRARGRLAAPHVDVAPARIAFGWAVACPPVAAIKRTRSALLPGTLWSREFPCA